MASTDGNTLADLIIGQYGTQGRAPVYHGVAQVGQSVVHQNIVLLLLVHGLPFGSCKGHFFRTGYVQQRNLLTWFVTAVAFKGFDQVLDGFGLGSIVVIIGIIHTDESPLRPFIISWITGLHFPVPIKGKANLVKLLPVAGNIAGRRDGRVLTCLNSVLFGW